MSRKATPDPKGGQLLKDAKGEPTGLFNERAQSIIGDALARDRAKRTRAQVDADLRKEIELASQESLSKGLTTVSDAGSPPATIELMKKVVDEHKLPVRVWMMLRETPDKLASDMPKYRVVNYGDKRFTVRAIKRSADGALGSRGAWMLAPYTDLPTTSGFNTDTLEDVRRASELAVINDYQVCVHAIGDRANREVLNVFEETFKRHPEKNGKQLRWRIEHAQHISAADIPRFGQLGVIASMQGIHATSDAPYVLARLGPKRAEEGAYVWQKLLKSGAIIANGTDAPVEDINPIASFYASVSRKVKDGSVFYPDQRMSRMEALRSYTIKCRVRRLRGNDQRVAQRRQAGRHYRAVEGHHDDCGGSDSLNRGGPHDRRREGGVHAAGWRRFAVSRTGGSRIRFYETRIMASSCPHRDRYCLFQAHSRTADRQRRRRGARRPRSHPRGENGGHRG